MFTQRFLRVVSICLVICLILVGPVFGQGNDGTDFGAGEVSNQLSRPSVTLDTAIQNGSSDLFHPFISLTSNIRGEAVGEYAMTDHSIIHRRFLEVSVGKMETSYY